MGFRNMLHMKFMICLMKFNVKAIYSNYQVTTGRRNCLEPKIISLNYYLILLLTLDRVAFNLIFIAWKVNCQLLQIKNRFVLEPSL